MLRVNRFASGLPRARRAYLRGIRRDRLRSREFALANACRALPAPRVVIVERDLYFGEIVRRKAALFLATLLRRIARLFGRA